jgi:hypothetical protein
MPSGPNGRAPLTIAAILAWADAHKARTGTWPRLTDKARHANLLPAGYTWSNIDTALRHGRHGLPGGDSLPQLLARERGLPNPRGKPLLTEDTILDWVKAHHQRTGKWPRTTSGAIKGLDEYWQRIEIALRAGTRALPGGSSLRLLRSRPVTLRMTAARFSRGSVVRTWYSRPS